MRIRELLLASALLLPAAVASAQHEVPSAAEAGPGAVAGQHADHDVHGATSLGALFQNSEFQGAVVNFVLLVIIFVVAMRKKVAPALIERRRQVEENLAEAQRIKEEAEATHREYTERLAKLDTELDQIRADMVKAGEADRNRIIAEAERRASSMRAETDFLIEQRMKELRDILSREAIEAAVSTAERVLAEKTTTDDQSRLAQSYLAAVGTSGKEKRA